MSLTWSEWAFILAILFFHASEFILALIYMREELGWHSLLFSKAYVVAMTLGVTEHLVWAWLVPGMRQQVAVSVCGLVLLACGELIRKAAMITAGANFTHKIRMQQNEKHQLVTRGVYRYLRHPGYFGWMLWAVGSQIMLINPICTPLFGYWACRFFQQRIDFEEHFLCRFFPEYEAYRSRTPTWIPGVP